MQIDASGQTIRERTSKESRRVRIDCGNGTPGIRSEEQRLGVHAQSREGARSFGLASC